MEIEKYIEKHLPGASFDSQAHKLTIRHVTTFPKDILEFADNIEILDMTGNGLDNLPTDFGKFIKLKIAFFGNNKFKRLPEVLSECTNLTFLGMKSCGIEVIPENVLPTSLRWLTLTDNKIAKLPDSFGELTNLQKLMLAGNQLHTLPSGIQNCQRLELIRLSANQFESSPLDLLLQLPNLAWYADSGNPFSDNTARYLTKLPVIPMHDIVLGNQIGQSAQNITYEATYDKAAQKLALKLFGGSLTSDGFPIDDMNASMAAGSHPNLIPVLGRIEDSIQGKQALLLERIPATYEPLGLPPTFATVSRDIFPESKAFSLPYIRKILTGVSSAAMHIHERGIMHGDLYAHNILANAGGHAFLTDFGAASLYPTNSTSTRERVDVRAFGYLIDDLLRHVKPGDITNKNQELQSLTNLRNQCLHNLALERPTFSEIAQQLANV